MIARGFRSMKSCETQPLEFIGDIVNTKQKRCQTDVLIMDFSKAFDKVGHNRLVEKLHFYGIQGKTNMWIKKFLMDREQTVVLEGEHSYKATVSSSVPQGSVLGPCLFLFYINDIPEQLRAKVTLHRRHCCIPKHPVKWRCKDLQKLGEWERKWQMEFHPAKCQVLSITWARQAIHYNYTHHGQNLEHVSTAKYLGLTITHDLRWNEHITNIAHNATRTLGFLRRNLQIHNPPTQVNGLPNLSKTITGICSDSMGPIH